MCHPHISSVAWDVEAGLRAFLSKCSMYKLANMGLTGDPIATLSTCSWNLFWNEIYVLCRQNPNKSIMFCTDNTVQSCNEVSCSSRSCMILSAGSNGTELNNAITSYEQRHTTVFFRYVCVYFYSSISFRGILHLFHTEIILKLVYIL